MLNSDQLQQLETQLAERSAALTARLSKLEESITEERARIDAEEAAQLRSAPRETKSALRQTWDRTRRKKISDLRHKLVEDSARDREDILSKVRDHSDEVEQTLALHANPVQILSREGLGESRRSDLQIQLHDAGPAELQATADLAIATQDRTLAAAVLVTADRDRKRHPRFERVRFAELVLGEGPAEFRKRLEAVKLTMIAMQNANRSFESGTSNSIEKISMGLAQKRLQPKTDSEAIGQAMRGQG